LTTRIKTLDYLHRRESGLILWGKHVLVNGYKNRALIRMRWLRCLGYYTAQLYAERQYKEHLKTTQLVSSRIRTGYQALLTRRIYVLTRPTAWSLVREICLLLHFSILRYWTLQIWGSKKSTPAQRPLKYWCFRIHKQVFWGLILAYSSVKDKLIMLSDTYHL
jgi:hypothetical protein